jgi:hypothetical protein
MIFVVFGERQFGCGGSHKFLAIAQLLTFIFCSLFCFGRFLLIITSNLLKPTGYFTYHQFNSQKFYTVLTLRLCFSYGSQNRQPYTTLSDWFCTGWSKSLCAPDYDTESLSIVQNVPRQSPDIDTPNCFLEDRQGQGDTRLTLTPSVIPNSIHVIVVSDWNLLKYFCVFFVV